MTAICAQKLLKLVSRPGKPFDFGCKEFEVSGYTKLARKMYPRKGICVVSGWMILDLKERKKTVESALLEGVSPSVLYSGCVELDFPSRFSPGRRVITTGAIDLVAPCFFITRNTVYILLCEGSRKDVDSELIYTFHF